VSYPRRLVRLMPILTGGSPKSLLSELIADGYVVAKNVLPLAFVNELRELLLANEEHLSLTRPEIIRRFGASKEFQDLFGVLVDDPESISFGNDVGAAIVYPGRSPMGWHMDWYGWGDPRANDEPVPLLGMFIYLQHTDENNAGLRVIPGSHRRWFDLVHSFGKGYLGDVGEAAITVVSEPGDVVAIDLRTLHGTHANITDTKRLFINFRYTVWSVPKREDRISWPRREDMMEWQT